MPTLPGRVLASHEAGPERITQLGIEGTTNGEIKFFHVDKFIWARTADSKKLNEGETALDLNALDGGGFYLPPDVQEDGTLHIADQDLQEVLQAAPLSVFLQNICPLGRRQYFRKAREYMLANHLCHEEAQRATAAHQRRGELKAKRRAHPRPKRSDFILS